jgi:hypothetical protein
MIDNDIDLTNNELFITKESNGNINTSKKFLDFKEPDKLCINKLFSHQHTIIDIVSRDDCYTIDDYYRIIYKDSKIDDPDDGFELYRMGVFCDNCNRNLYHTDERVECEECFDSRMLKENKLNMIGKKY